jgi:hypothetical protein
LWRKRGKARLKICIFATGIVGNPVVLAKTVGSFQFLVKRRLFAKFLTSSLFMMKETTGGIPRGTRTPAGI